MMNVLIRDKAERKARREASGDNVVHPIISEWQEKANAARATGFKTVAGATILVGEVKMHDGKKAGPYAAKISGMENAGDSEKDLLFKLLAERSGVGIRALQGDAKKARKDADEKERDGQPPTKEGWPKGYSINDGSLCHERWTDKGIQFDKLCDALEVVGTMRDESREGWALLLRFKGRGGVQREISMTFADILSGPGPTIAALANGGLKIDGAKERKEKLFTCLSRLDTKKYIVAVDQPGLYDGALVTPIGKVINGNPDLLRLSRQ